MNNQDNLFVKQFLATLYRKKNVRTIPINDEAFKMGISKMAQYFNENKIGFGQYANNLDSLFLKYSIRGNYTKFSKIIENFNGRIVALENPRYVKANIQLENDYADELCSNHDLGIPIEKFEQLAQCFMEGACIK